MSKMYPSPQFARTHLQHTLYDSRFEHDACGIGFVAYADGKPHPNILPMALQALANLVHRGGVAADGKTSDGAGILCQLPYTFFSQELKKHDLKPPTAGNLGVGQLFLPKNEQALAQSIDLIKDVFDNDDLGLDLLLWRDVPTDRRILGPQAEATQPTLKQIMVAPRTRMAQAEFERRLYLTRRIIEAKTREAGLEEALYICSLSSRVIVYKGLLLGDALGKFYLDLQNYDFQVGMATFHQRYSTNTFPAWPLAQPFRIVCHNGEINTIDGNVNWMRARESQLASEVWGDDINYLKPVIDESSSDSARFDNVLELLTQSGRSLPHAIALMAPEAWEMLPDTPENKARRDFYAYHACLMEPWDGPAALVFCDGETVGITLDRNGLRPMRTVQTNDGLVIASSEVGCVTLDEASIIKKSRLGPGQMLVVETATQTVYDDQAIKAKLARQVDYGQWLEDTILLPKYPHSIDDGDGELQLPLETYQSTFGYTAEELTVVLRPMSMTGKEPIGSMGDDTPIALLSDMNRPVHHYLKQRFAQVTNPPIDPLREQSGMSLRMLLGHRGNILQESKSWAKQLKLDSPVLQNSDLAAISDHPAFETVKLYANFNPKKVTEIKKVLQNLATAAENAIRKRGAALIIISDKAIDSESVPIPILLALGIVHHTLIKNGLRSHTSLIVETGEVRDVHHLATLIGYGAEAVNPYLALASVAKLAKSGKLREITVEEAIENYSHALELGLLKIMSKMGISTIDSYCGAQIFEAMGLGEEVIDLCLTGTPSKLGGASLVQLATGALQNHQKTFGEAGPRLESPGLYKFKRNGEYHGYNPTIVRTLQKAVKTDNYQTYKQFSKLADQGAIITPKDGLKIQSDQEPIPLDEVESLSEILRRFSTAAMSHGALSSEAHETLAIAMSRIGGMSNSGEGGEAPSRFDNEGNSTIKQVASGRFGVTPAYLMSARELQIKMAQGSKPGEGGQLPGHKVTEEIASLRFSSPGVELISPPPHHDIYSIEDLAQLIYDLKQIKPMAHVSVKLVAESGVGTIAAGVVKGGADVVHISGGSGGTGASPLSSIKSAGLPFEMGLAETQQTLIANDLRDRVRIRADGGMQTGRDVVMAAILGADEYSFGTAALIAEGCIMARSCHTNTCPVGIATQRPELRLKFPGKPEWVISYFTFIAQEVREILAHMGYRRLNDIIGRTELLAQVGIKELDLSPLTATPDESGFLPRRNMLPVNDITTVSPTNWRILEATRPAFQQNKHVKLNMAIHNGDRSIGATLSGAIAAQYGSEGLPEGQIEITFMGSAGQSFGVFNSPGMHLTVVGDANDYVGKGMAGGEIVIKLPEVTALHSHKNNILGNTALYGATGGALYAAGLAGERFAVRNSGATAVVEGVGNHGCEYMTGGTIVILGETGFNFGAGMSGGVAYVYDINETLGTYLNPDMVTMTGLQDSEETVRLYQLIDAHYKKTGSQHAKQLLSNWEVTKAAFKKVAPIFTARPKQPETQPKKKKQRALTNGSHGSVQKVKV